jgi:hypothetical protein
MRAGEAVHNRGETGQKNKEKPWRGRQIDLAIG